MKPPVDAPSPQDYLAMAARWWWIVVVAAVVSGTAGGAVWLMDGSKYRSTVDLFAVVDGPTSVRAAFENSRGGLSRMPTYAGLATTPEVIDRAAGVAGVPPGELADRVAVDYRPDSVLMHISVTDSDRARAQRSAQAMGAAMVAIVDAVEKTDQGPATVLTPVGSASPSVPVRDSLWRDIGFGAVLGVAWGVVGMFAVGLLSGHLLTGGQVARLMRRVLEARSIAATDPAPHRTAREAVVGSPGPGSGPGR